ncbi:MAG: DUF721 domain-containing protein [Lysobacterales bacterium]|nr:MAG: DUF721 domain-containing protein [Xanthomonadales bacterium]
MARRQTMPERAAAGNRVVAFINHQLTMSDPLKPLFSGSGSALEALARRAAETTALADVVRSALPELVRPHVVAAVRRGEDLVVIVDSAAWSARVRYAGPRLQEALAGRGEPVAGKVRVRVGRYG